MRERRLQHDGRLTQATFALNMTVTMRCKGSEEEPDILIPSVDPLLGMRREATGRK